MIKQSREQIPIQKRVTMTIDSGQERLREIFKLYSVLVLGNIQACKTNQNDFNLNGLTEYFDDFSAKNLNLYFVSFLIFSSGSSARVRFLFD